MVRSAIKIFIVLTIFKVAASNNDEKTADLFLKDYEIEMSKLCREVNVASWDYMTNITDENKEKMTKAASESAEFSKNAWKNVSSWNWTEFENKSTRRQFKLLSVIGTAALHADEFIKFTEITTRMQTIYSESTICDQNNKCGLNLDPEITEIMATSRDPDQLLLVWREWHDIVGNKTAPLYPQYVELSNKAALENGFKNMADLWLDYYEEENFENSIEKLWNQVRPLYEQLHAYVRKKLHHQYKDIVALKKPIPAHLLGNMWAQTWENIADLVLPFPGKSQADATPQMKAQNYDAKKMFETAQEFYTSLGLEPLPESFWNKSMITRPSDGRKVVCHASAWDFCDRQDVRIKMCTKVTMEDFIVIHHELGHIQYYQQYKDQPILYRSGANPGFHEAVGDTMALSASTESHLFKIGLLPTPPEQDKEAEINFLMYKALQKVAFLPFGYVADMWRWRVFRGEIKPHEYNDKWWELRKIYQGIEPAVPRSKDTFDPGAKYHIAADVEYLRYFVAAIIQFQFHRSLCIEANEFDVNNHDKPLYKCDIYQNKNAGKLLSSMLQLGASEPWPDAMMKISGVRDMDASALMDYFKPLYDFLVEENKKNNEEIGWMGDSSSVPLCSFALQLLALGVLYYLPRLTHIL